MRAVRKWITLFFAACLLHLDIAVLCSISRRVCRLSRPLWRFHESVELGIKIACRLGRPLLALLLSGTSSASRFSSTSRVASAYASDSRLSSTLPTC